MNAANVVAKWFAGARAIPRETDTMTAELALEALSAAVPGRWVVLDTQEGTLHGLDEATPHHGENCSYWFGGPGECNCSPVGLWRLVDPQ